MLARRLGLRLPAVRGEVMSGRRSGRAGGVRGVMSEADEWEEGLGGDMAEISTRVKLKRNL